MVIIGWVGGCAKRMGARNRWVEIKHCEIKFKKSIINYMLSAIFQSPLSVSALFHSLCVSCLSVSLCVCLSVSLSLTHSLSPLYFTIRPVRGTGRGGTSPIMSSPSLRHCVRPWRSSRISSPCSSYNPNFLIYCSKAISTSSPKIKPDPTFSPGTS